MPLRSKQPRVLGLVPDARDAEAGRGPPVFVSGRGRGPHRSGDHSTEPEEQALAGGLAEGMSFTCGNLLFAPYPGIHQAASSSPDNLALEP